MKFKHYKLGDRHGYKKRLYIVRDIFFLSFILAIAILATPQAKAEVEIASVSTTPLIAITESTPWRSVPTKLHGTPEQNEKLAYAWKISGYDIQFIYVLNGENALFDHTRRHDNSANTHGTDWGFGVNDYWHPEVVNDPKFFSDWRWQIDRVYQMWSGGTVFYGYSTKGILLS